MMSPPGAAPERRARAGVILALVVGAVGIYKAIESMTSPALPILQNEFDATRAQIAWVITGILLTGPVFTPLIGRLGDLYDKRKVLLSVLVIVGCGLLASALSVSMPMLIAGQLLQGLGLGTVPLAVGIMKQTQSETRLKTGNGLMIGVIYVCTALAMLASGLIIDRLHYSFLFWLPFALLIGMIIATWFLVPPCLPEEKGGAKRIDFLGATLFGGGLALLLVSLTYAPDWGWTSAGFFSLLVGAVLLFAIFIIVELKLRNPLVDVRILLSRNVLAASWLMIIGGFTMNVLFITVPMQIQQPLKTGYGLGAGGTLTGIVLVIGVLAGALAPIVSLIDTRFGLRAAAVCGPAVVVIAFVLLIFSAGNLALVLAGTLAVGFGTGVSIAQAMNIIVASVPNARVGAFSGMNFVVKAIGSTSGAQIAASVLSTDAAAATKSPDWSSFIVIFWIGLAVAGLAVVLGSTLSRKQAVPASETTVDQQNVQDLPPRPQPSTKLS